MSKRLKAEGKKKKVKAGGLARHRKDVDDEFDVLQWSLRIFRPCEGP